MAREFDGANGVLYNTSTASDSIASGNLTLSAWIYADTTGEGGAGRILDKRNVTWDGDSAAGSGMIFYTTGTAAIAWAVINSSNSIIGNQVANSNTCPLGQWNHVLVTYADAGDRKGHIYVNGSEVTYATDTATSGTIGTHTGDFLIGNHAALTEPIRTFDGRIAEVGIYTVVLDAGEISALGAGYAPIMIRSQSLIHYVPLHGQGGTNSNEVDRIGGTWVKGWANNVTVVDSPARIIRPRRRKLYVTAVADVSHRIIGGGWGGRVIGA